MKFNKTGYIVTSILITIGADLWYTRSDFQPQPQDFSELMNAVQERCLATRFSTNGTYHFTTAGGYDCWENQPVIVSNGQYSIVKGEDDAFSFFQGTNSYPYTIPIMQPVAPYTNNTVIGGDGRLVVINGIVTFYDGWDVLSQNAIALDKTYVENDPTNRWILGTFESFTVSGFPEADFNGVYRRHYDAYFWDGTWYAYNVGYTNSTGCSMSPGETETTFQNAESWWDGSYYTMHCPPWFGGVVSDGSFNHRPKYQDFHITCVRGPLATNVFIRTIGGKSITNVVPEKIIDRPCYSKTYVCDWVVDTRKPRWGDFFGVIDLVLWGGCNSGPGYPSSRFTPSGKSVLYQGFLYYSNSPSGYNSGQHFLNPTKWGTSQFNNISELYLPVSSWGLTNTVNYTNGANISTIYGFDDSIILPMGFNNWTDFRVDPSADQFNKHAFDQRRAALQQCTVLRMNGGKAKWVPPNVTNNVRWSAYVWSTNGYADVCAKAKAACTNQGTEVGAPYSWCYARVYPGTPPYPTYYYMAMQSRDAKMIMFLDTNNQCEASTYVRAALPTVNYAPVTNRFFGNDSSVSISTTNIFEKVNSIPMGYHFAYSNLVVQNYNNIFPPVPVSNGYNGAKMIGYTLEGDQSTEVITKWDFQYCAP